MRELSFQRWVEEALYDPVSGYYSGRRMSPSKTGDFVTSPLISPAFSYALARLFGEFVDRIEADSYSFVDVGCADGFLLSSVLSMLDSVPAVEVIGIDRSDRARRDDRIRFATSISDVPSDRPAFVICNELYDAFPFTRVVMRSTGLHELWVRESDESREWVERPATADQIAYLDRNGVMLDAGQFADFSMEWETFHRNLTSRVERLMVVVFDYGYEADRLFSSRIRRYGTAAGYRGQRVHRDLLEAKGESDLTAHVNFTDLMRAMEASGGSTLSFDRQNGFLLKIGILGHPDLAPAEEENAPTLEVALNRNDERDSARRLILPDGIGEEMRVLVQTRGIPTEGWSFQKKLY